MALGRRLRTIKAVRGSPQKGQSHRARVELVGSRIGCVQGSYIEEYMGDTRRTTPPQFTQLYFTVCSVVGWLDVLS